MNIPVLEWKMFVRLHKYIAGRHFVFCVDCGKQIDLNVEYIDEDYEPVCGDCADERIKKLQ